MVFNPNDWKNAFKLTIEHTLVDDVLTDFPVAVVLSSGTGITGYDVSNIFDDLGESYKKIAITTVISGVETELYVEVEGWSTTSGNAILWTKVPTISSGTDTELFLYYDTDQTINTTYVGDTGETPAQNVWDDNFIAVWHMSQDPSLGGNCILDSTSYGHNGAPQNMDSGDLIVGQIGGALSFNGSNKYIVVTDTDILDLNSGGYTIESIINTDVSTRGGVVTKLQTGSPFYGWMIDYSFPTADKFSLFANHSSSSWQANSTDVTHGSWESIVATSNGKYFLNGAPDGTHTQSATPAVTSQPVWIGRNYNNNYFNGYIDEIRISVGNRPAEWVKATRYSNTNNLITFSFIKQATHLTYYFDGYVTVRNQSVNRQLNLHRRDTGSFIGSTTSSGTEGYYYIETTYTGTHYLVCFDDAIGEDFNDLIRGNILPYSTV